MPAPGRAVKNSAMRKNPVAIGFALVVSVSPGPVLAGNRFEEISHTARQLLHAEQLPSIVVAIAKDGRVVWQEGFGWADRERRIPATPRTPYSLASISKPFTATAVMKLVEAKRIGLDRQANDYLGDARIAGHGSAKATVRRVLSHTAGLPPYFRAFFGNDRPPIEDTIAKYALLTSPPGRRHVYSNLGYGILEHIIRRGSGLSYEEFMQREVFAPLQLTNASIPVTASPQVAVRYDAHDRPLPFYDVGPRGASAVCASANDLVRFGMYHLKEPLEGAASILTGKRIDEMQRIQTPESSTDGYGLGWRIRATGTHFREIGHTGGMPGVTTVLNLYPAERLVIVILTNKRNDAIVRLGQQIAAILMPHYGWRLRHAPAMSNPSR